MNIDLLQKSIRAAAEITFSRSGGPGGQNVNKVNTKVTLRLDLRNLEGLSEAERIRVYTVLSGRLIAENEIIVSSGEERSQYVNRERAYARLQNLITSSVRIPRSRRPTKPTRASREERLLSKHRRGHIKAERRYNPEE